MNKKILGIVGAVALAVVGTFALVGYVNGAEARAVAGEKRVDVFVVRDPIRAGTPISDIVTRVRSEKVPIKVRANSAVVDLKQLDGLVAAVDLVPGEQLLVNRFVPPGSSARPRSSVIKVPDGMHELTLELDPQRALGGQLRPGDTVGVVASFDPFDANTPGGIAGPKSPNTSHMTLHKVLVTRMYLPPLDANSGSNPATNDAGVAQPLTKKLMVTVALKAPQVERVVFAAEFGKVWLTYEPSGAPESGTRIVTRNNIYQAAPKDVTL